NFPGAQDDERRVDSSRGRRNQTCRMTTEPCQKNKMPQLCNAEDAETDAEKKHKNEFFSAISACSAVKDWIERVMNHGVTMIVKNAAEVGRPLHGFSK
ncbi:MAG: hypothetical protein ABSB74_14860, partial [Tepidisphaeraceae bacterium]